MLKSEEFHQPVMLHEVLHYFQDLKIQTFFDGTVGAGGHAAALLQTHPEIEMYIACDRDPAALQLAEKRLSPWTKKLRFVHGNFADLDQHLRSTSLQSIDGFFLI